MDCYSARVRVFPEARHLFAVSHPAMEFAFLPLEEDLARRLGLPIDRGFPVATDRLRAGAAAPTLDLPALVEQIETYRSCHEEDSAYDGFLKRYHHFTAATLANQEHLEAALPHFERAYALDPEDDDVRSDLARVAFELRHFDRALALYREAVAKNAATLETYEGMARIHMAAGQAALALEAAQEARRRWPERWESANLLTTIHYHGREIARLESSLHEQLALDPRNLLTLEKLAVYYRECARFAEARMVIDRALAQDKTSARLRYQSGMIDYGMGRYTEAEREFTAALALEEAHLDSLNGLGLLYLDASRPEEARATLERAVAIAPRDYRAPMNLGRLWFRPGSPDRAQAVPWFARALDLGMDDAGALKYVYIAARELGEEGLAQRAQRLLDAVTSAKSGAASAVHTRAKDGG